MAKYVKNTAVVEAITFDEFVEYGKSVTDNIVKGMPWSFTFEGFPVTHENDYRYFICKPEGHIQFDKGNILIKQPDGSVFVCNEYFFADNYSKVQEQ